MDDKLALATIPVTKVTLSQGVFESAQLFEHAQRIAKCLSSSTMVPDRYRGDGNIGNCVIAIDIAYRLGMPPLMVMQHLYVVYGTPSWSGQMVTALINNTGMFNGPIRHEFKGKQGQDDWGCRCVGVLKDTGKSVEGPWVDIATAKAEGWYDRKDKEGRAVSKWRTIPDLMLRYRAAAYFGRTVCPEVTIGLRTREEEEDVGGEYIDTTTAPIDDKPALDAPTPAPLTVIDKTEPRKRKEPAKAPAKVEPEPENKSATTPEPVTPPGASIQAGETAAPVNTPPTEPINTVTPPCVLLDEALSNSNVEVDDFFSWCKGTGLAQTWKFDADKLQSIEELPEPFVIHLLATPKLLANCVKTYGKPAA